MNHDLDLDLDPRKFIEQRRHLGLTQESLAEKAGYSDRQIRRLESGAGVSAQLAADVAKALGKSLEFFTWGKTAVRSPEEHHLLQRKGVQIAITFCAAGAWALKSCNEALRNPHMHGIPETDPGKIDPNDRTKLVDRISGEIIAKVFNEAANQEGHIFSQGFWWIPEETCAKWIPGRGKLAKRKVAVITDEADDTPAFSTRLGGTILMAFYEETIGWLSACVADFARNRLYYRILNSPTASIQLDESHGLQAGPPSPDQMPRGQAITLTPSTKTTVDRSSINLYLGKPSRILQSAALGRGLLKRNIEAIHSKGGSLGPILVADGSVDASVEFVKGFKRIDLIPGLFVAQGAGAKVFELTEDFDLVPFDFGMDAALEDILESAGNMSKKVESARQRFVVAGTDELAEEIAEALREGGN